MIVFLLTAYRLAFFATFLYWFPILWKLLVLGFVAIHLGVFYYFYRVEQILVEMRDDERNEAQVMQVLNDYTEKVFYELGAGCFLLMCRYGGQFIRVMAKVNGLMMPKLMENIPPVQVMFK